MAILRFAGFELAPEGSEINADSWGGTFAFQGSTDAVSCTSSAFTPALAGGRYSAKFSVESQGSPVQIISSYASSAAPTGLARSAFYRFYIYVASPTPSAGSVSLAAIGTSASSTTTMTHFINYTHATRQLSIAQGTTNTTLTNAIPLNTLIRVEGSWVQDGTANATGVATLNWYTGHSTTSGGSVSVSNYTYAYIAGTSHVRTFRFGIMSTVAQGTHSFAYTIYMDELAVGDSAIGPATTDHPVLTGQPNTETVRTPSSMQYDLGSKGVARLASGLVADATGIQYEWLRDGVVLGRTTSPYFTDYNAPRDAVCLYGVRAVRTSNEMTSGLRTLSVTTAAAVAKAPVIEQVVTGLATGGDSYTLTLQKPMTAGNYFLAFAMTNTPGSHYYTWAGSVISTGASGGSSSGTGTSYTRGFLTSPSNGVSSITLPVTTTGQTGHVGSIVFVELSGVPTTVYFRGSTNSNNASNNQSSASSSTLYSPSTPNNEWDTYAFIGYPTPGTLTMPAGFSTVVTVGTGSRPQVNFLKGPRIGMNPSFPVDSSGSGGWSQEAGAPYSTYTFSWPTAGIQYSILYQLGYMINPTTGPAQGITTFNGTTESKLGPPIGIWDGSVVTQSSGDSIT